MNKYKVIYTEKFVKEKNLQSKYEYIFGQTEDSALSDSSIERKNIYGIYLLAPLAPEGTTAFEALPKKTEEQSAEEETQESVTGELGVPPVDSVPQTEFDFDAEAAGVAETAPVDRAGGADSISE